VTEYDDQSRAESLGCELDASDLRRRDDVTGNPDDEEVSESLIEHQLGGHARIGAAEYDGERLLRSGELQLAARPWGAVITLNRGYKPAVPILESFQSFSG
jgi:hypothetical protein